MAQFIVEIPDDVVAAGLFEDAAATTGWQATLEGGAPNPVTAIAACFYSIVVPILKNLAIGARTDRQMIEIRNQARADMEAAAAAWQAAMQEQGGQ